MRLDGFGLFVDDMPAMVRFYRDVLGFEIALYVDTSEEVDKEYARIVAQGGRSVLEPETEPWGQRTCYIADPEGNLVEIGSFNRPFESKTNFNGVQ